jgi:F-type H+-transporting ATPase subunit delta
VDRLVAALSKVVGKKLVPHVAVDPSLLGGLVARVGDEIFDGSIKGKLARAKVALQSTRIE